MTLGIKIVDSNASRNPYSVITIISFNDYAYNYCYKG